VLEQVAAVFAQVLQMPPERLDPDLTFENYGVDSLVALELTRGLEAAYGPLPSTLLFERITIRRLAEYFRAKASPRPEERERKVESAPPRDTELRDAASRDAKSRDAASRDAESRDAKSRDAKSRDAKSRDAASRDAESRDAASRDAASRDAASRDAASRGAGSRDVESLVASLPDAVVDELLAELLSQRNGSAKEATR
jgi:acyl carrier protein